MWPPVLQQVLDSLRRDDANPIHALDRWLLVAVPGAPPSTLQELAVSAVVRMGPGGRGPELKPSQLMRWMYDAGERKLILSNPAFPAEKPGRLNWSLTGAGIKRLEDLRGVKAGVGGLLRLVARRPKVWAYAIERLRQQEEVDIAEPPPKRSLPKDIGRSPGDDQIPPENALENLQAVKHIVVLMMENRSFDHMLGYLDLLDGQDQVNGLRHAKQITHQGRSYGPEYLVTTAFPKSMDPPHGRKEIAKQINGGKMDGFIESFARKNDPPDPGRVMGYYTHRELPVYDFFAFNFTLCDRWFSSVPSSTWHNRLYALAGTCDPDRESLMGNGKRFFDKESFVRLLKGNEDPNTWRWYSWDPGSLRLVDSEYRPPKHIYHDNFRRVAQHSIEPDPPTRDERDDTELALGTGLLQDAARGDLPRVAWIDPNFVDLSILDPNSNDDHPPSDVRSGQELVMMVFRALAESPCWNETMLIVTYDEHGGFYDHQAPDEPPEEAPQFDSYGVRVPAFVVSPLVEPGTVSHRAFDHTSIIRTILERFGIDGAVEKMAETAPRVACAEHLGRLLTRRPPPGSGPPDYAHVNALLNSWRHGRAERRSAASAEVIQPEMGTNGEETKITGFPADFLAGARELRNEGLSPGHP
jgi:phospholipase C